MIDREAYENAQAGIETANRLIEKLRSLMGETLECVNPAVHGMVDALADAIGTIEVERVDLEEDVKDYHKASNRLSVE